MNTKNTENTENTHAAAPPRSGRTALVIGAGPAGIFAAIEMARANPGCVVRVLERGHEPLAKVRVSGGGRCNLTHACFDPVQLSGFYPRGGRELRGPLSRFGPRETLDWFAARGVPTRAEPDGRVFPATNRSATVVDALLREAAQAGVHLSRGADVRAVRAEDGGFRVSMAGEELAAQRLVLATGGSAQGFALAASLGHTVAAPVPALFSLRLADARLEDLAGVSVPEARLEIEDSRFSESGALLVTHWGLSGPAALCLSSRAARLLAERGYRTGLRVNWLGATAEADVHRTLQSAPFVPSRPPWPQIPARLWHNLARACNGAQPGRTQCSRALRQALAEQLLRGRFTLEGRGANKGEFVTCGGVSLKEIDLRTLTSRVRPGLQVVGELLDIDGLTGGFNLQNAWTTGWLAGQAPWPERPD